MLFCMLLTLSNIIARQVGVMSFVVAILLRIQKVVFLNKDCHSFYVIFLILLKFDDKEMGL